MTKVILADPPNGWLYGFPAPLQENYRQQLKNAGYPEEDIDFAVKYSRFWESSDD